MLGFCFVFWGGSGFWLLLWEVMTHLNANGFWVKMEIIKITLPSPKHLKKLFWIKRGNGHGRRKKHVFTI